MYLLSPLERLLLLLLSGTVAFLNQSVPYFIRLLSAVVQLAAAF
jgi:hypothetical protein